MPLNGLGGLSISPVSTPRGPHPQPSSARLHLPTILNRALQAPLSCERTDPRVSPTPGVRYALQQRDNRGNEHDLHTDDEGGAVAATSLPKGN
jgi:hypothetical protein